MKKEEIKKQLEEIKTLLRKQNDQPLNFVQAAQYLGFSHSYLYKLTSRKIIPCHRPTGKMLFFSKVELDEWIFSSKKSKVKSEKSNEMQGSDEDEEDPASPNGYAATSDADCSKWDYE
ncbi:MAG: helix-turn-helix domain-containing protein [Ignavibacterium sp.]|jgi:excisionase family DNA binding protein|nr:helix-turn-helix domain-containing protein [Ignavibacterium sp.]